jgi:CheY-like chemotaxis protein
MSLPNVVSRSVPLPPLSLESLRDHRADERATLIPRESSGTTAARVLVVDDDPGNRETLCAALTMLGHMPTIADSGWSAVRLLRTPFEVDVIVSDVVMPGMDGIDFARRARTLRRGVPIIMVTGYSDTVDKLIESGVVALMKPFSMETLAQVLDEVLATGIDAHRVVIADPRSSS